MKRRLLVFAMLALAVMIGFPSLASAEDESVVIRVATVDGVVGTEVNVAVRLENCDGVDSAEFDINYDPEALELVSVTPGDVFPVEYCVTNTETAGRVAIACARADGFTGDGTLLTLRFLVLNGTGSALTVTSHLPSDILDRVVSRVDDAYVQSFPYVTVINGSIRASSAAYPEALVTPWTPATPTPSPTPTPEPTNTPAATPEATAAQADDTAETPDITAYLVVASLCVVLIILIASSLSRRRTSRAKNNGEPDA